MKLIILLLLSFNLYAANSIKTNQHIKDGKELRLYNSANSFYTGLKGNGTASVTFTLPQADGTSGQLLQTSGTGTLSFGNLDTGTASLTNYNTVGSWGVPITATMSINRAINALSNQYASSATQTQYSLSVSGTNWTTVRAVGIPYVTTDGTWRLRFNIVGSTTTQTSNTLTVSGVTFKSATDFNQSVNVTSLSGFAGWGWTGINASTISIFCSSNSTSWSLSGDVELNSKPSWAN